MCQDTSAEDIFEYLVYSLRLSARLRVESGAEREFGSEGFLELLPESRGELCALVRHNLLWNSMKAHDAIDVEVGYLDPTIGEIDGNKVGYLVEVVTMTQMESCPLLDLVNPVMKSTPTLSHFHSGTLRGCNSPAGH